MKTEICSMTTKEERRPAILRAAKLLREGKLVAFPTETVYGLGGNGLDPQASSRIYAAKGRPSDNPLILHISDRSELSPLVKRIPGIVKIAEFPPPCSQKYKHKNLQHNNQQGEENP